MAKSPASIQRAVRPGHHLLAGWLAMKLARPQARFSRAAELPDPQPGVPGAGLMTYANISDPVVLAYYQCILRPGLVIAGPLADTLRTEQLGQDSLDWLKTNFYETELELGHCLRLQQEGPCECGLYLTCATFVATSQYAPQVSTSASALTASPPTTPKNGDSVAKSNVTAEPRHEFGRSLMNSARPMRVSTDLDEALVPDVPGEVLL